MQYLLPSGVDAHELQETLRDAAQYLRELGGLHPGSEIPVGAITVHARDGELVVEFQVQVGEPPAEGSPVDGKTLWGPDGPPTFPVPPADWLAKLPAAGIDRQADAKPDTDTEVTAALSGEEQEPAEPEPSEDAEREPGDPDPALVGLGGGVSAGQGPGPDPGAEPTGEATAPQPEAEPATGVGQPPAAAKQGGLLRRIGGNRGG